jgi:hypothetical protein
MTANLLLRIGLAIAITVSSASAPPLASADCSYPNDGKVITIAVESCEVISGKTNKEVLKYSGAAQKTETIQKLSTGALVRAKGSMKWMYPSTDVNPCKQFARSAQVKMRAYLTCCDTGPWGQCVFGGRWLADVDGKEIDASQ